MKRLHQAPGAVVAQAILGIVHGVVVRRAFTMVRTRLALSWSGAAWPLRGSSRPQTRTNAHLAAAAQGAAMCCRRGLIPLAKAKPDARDETPPIGENLEMPPAPSQKYQITN